MQDIPKKMFDAIILPAVEETPIFNVIMEVREDFLTDKSFPAFMKIMDQTIAYLKKMHENEDIYFLQNEIKVSFDKAIEDIYSTFVTANFRHHPNAKGSA